MLAHFDKLRANENQLTHKNDNKTIEQLIGSALGFEICGQRYKAFTSLACTGELVCEGLEDWITS